MAATLKTAIGLVVIAGLWWTMAQLVLSSDSIYAGIQDAMASAPPALQADGVWIEDHSFSDCCHDFQEAFALSVFATLFSAIPMGLLAPVLQRRSASVLLKSFSRAALMVQGASMMLNLLLMLLWLPALGVSSIRLTLFLVAGFLIGFVAIPAWYRLSRVSLAATH